MSEIKKLIDDIKKLRENLYRIIEQQGYDMNDNEVLEASRSLNVAITNYNNLLKEKII